MNRVQKIILISLFSSFPLFSQETVLQYNGSGSYVYIERTDLRRYDNGKYTGLVSREIRSYMSPMSVPSGGNPEDRYYDGNFYVSEDTVRARSSVSGSISSSIPSTFRIASDGQLFMIRDNGYPTFRSFPSFTRKQIKYGDRWQAKGVRVVDPLNKGIKTKIPIYVEYVYLKDDVFHGQDVYVISASWATRYGTASSMDFGGDRELKFAQGKHRANILVSKKTGDSLVVRDTVDEEFEYLDGNRIAFKGTISMFTEYPPSYDREKLFPALQRMASVSKDELEKIMQNTVDDAGKGAERKNDFKREAVDEAVYGENSVFESNGNRIESEKEMGAVSSNGKKESKKGARNAAMEKFPSKNQSGSQIKGTDSSNSSEKGPQVTVENTSAGIRLTMQNLKFKPDSAELLNGESSRLDEMASLLKMVPDQMILVEGHTASVGNPEGEMRLSLERAAAIKDALVRRGVPAEKFIMKGSGGTKPVADNSTQAGKARNRRVEITILD